MSNILLKRLLKWWSGFKLTKLQRITILYVLTLYAGVSFWSASFNPFLLSESQRGGVILGAILFYPLFIVFMTIYFDYGDKK